MAILKSAIVAAALLTGLASLAQAAEVASADQVAAGRDFARRVCGACHVVTRPDEIPLLTPPGPSFAVLAQRPSLTEQALRQFLASNHRGMGPNEAMPNPRLADYQIDRIVAFMLSLKGGK